MSDTRVLPPFPPDREPGHEPGGPGDGERNGPSTPERRPDRPGRRGGLAAAVLVGALLVGGGAGIGGAAAYESWQDEPGVTGSGSVKTAQVVDTGEQQPADGSVEAVAADVLPSVVKIDVAGPQGAGSGSGIILSSDGEILTNNHVVEVAGESGRIVVSFDDGSHAKAKILGTDPLTDTAVIKADGVSDLTPATIGKSGNVDVGQQVVAVGSPFGLDSTVTSGIVSALDRPVNVGTDPQGNATVYPAIQTDAAINPGNSGGPLVDMNGHVIGINASIRTTGSSMGGEAGSIGLGFAIPIDEVVPLVDEMADGQTPAHARIGISVADAVATDQLITDGAVVREVATNAAADDAGLQVGDVITKVDDHVITGADSLVATIRSYRPGDKVSVTVNRDGDEQTLDITLQSDLQLTKS